MAQRLFIFKNNFLSECLQGRRLLCQFSAVGCTNMTASSSLSDFAASIFIVSPYCEVYPIFSKNTPLQHPLSVYQRKPFCECKSRYSFFPSSFSPLPLLPLPLPPPPLCVCVWVCARWWAFWKEMWHLNAWANLFGHLPLEREEGREEYKWQRHYTIAGNSSSHIRLSSVQSFLMVTVLRFFFFFLSMLLSSNLLLQMEKWKFIESCCTLVR